MAVLVACEDKFYPPKNLVKCCLFSRLYPHFTPVFQGIYGLKTTPIFWIISNKKSLLGIRGNLQSK